MQDTFARALVYKIPYRHARAWPGGRVRARAKVSCIQLARALGLKAEQPLGQARATIGYLVYNYNITALDLRSGF